MAGERGPLPKPAQLHLLHGNPSKKPMAALLDEKVRPKVEIPEAPKHLIPEARAEWTRIVTHLEQLGLISQIDRAALSAYCQAWGRWVDVEGKIAELNKKDKQHLAGLIGDTPSGYKQISVLLQISNRCVEQMEKFLSHFGMSPAARSRVTASDPQIALPGMDKPQEGGWGTFKR
jgi:P27 family predicted phage terminase small subunit